MKKLIIFMLLISMILVGCDKTTSGGNADIDIDDINRGNANTIDYSYTGDIVRQRTITEYSTNGKETKLVPDESAKGELNVSGLLYSYIGSGTDYYDTAVGLFKKTYPNVEVKIDKSTSYKDYRNQLNKDIQNGNGPDLFWSFNVQDPYKLMKSENLTDLTPYIENDKDFNIDDYNKKVFYEGQLNGKQYIVPVDYNLPLMLTTQNIIDETGIDVLKCDSYIGFAEEIEKIVKVNKFGLTKGNIITNFYVPFVSPFFSGISWVDYENGKVDLNAPAIKRVYELTKNSYVNSVETYNPYERYNIPTSSGNPFTGKETVMSDMTLHSFLNTILSSRSLLEYGQTPVVLPWRDVNGKIEAATNNGICVPKNSRNIENAYRFIKVITSTEFYESFYMHNEIYANIPINNKVVKTYLEQNPNEKGVYENFKDTISALKPLPQDYIDTYMGYINDVESASFFSIEYKILELMKPYLEGKKTYEECIQETQSKLEAYIAE